MNIPDSLPVIDAHDVIPYLKERRDFIWDTVTGLNSEHAYVVRQRDVAICFVCTHGELYVRRDPRPEWGAGIMMALIVAYGYSGIIDPEHQVPCSDKTFDLACLVHDIQADASDNLGTTDLSGLAESIIKNNRS